VTEPASLTPFSQLLAAIQAEGDGFGVDLPGDWLQGRTAYGGLTAALCVAAGQRRLEAPAPLRSAQFAFIGPSSGRLAITPTVLRQGKSSVYMGVDLVGDAGIAARALLCFGATRPSRIDYQSLPAPDVADWNSCPAYFKGGQGPSFAVHFDSRLAAGAWPLTPGAEPDMSLWLKHREAGAGATMVGLVALADALPPASIIQFPERAPFSTMTWSIDMLTDAPASVSDWWLIRSTAERTGQGYSAQAMTLWNDRREAVMVARQQVALFV